MMNLRAIELLRSWRKGNEQEQRETWAHLKKTLGLRRKARRLKRRQKLREKVKDKVLSRLGVKKA